MDYSSEPSHSDKLFIQAQEPFNAEPPVAPLVEFVYVQCYDAVSILNANRYTPEDLVYCVRFSERNQ